MASDAQIEVMRRKHDKEQKQLDREQRERESKRKAVTDVITSVTSNLVPNVKLGGGDGKPGSKYVINASDWYKKWVDIKLFAQIPEFNDITIYRGNLTKGSVNYSTGVITNNSLPLITIIKYAPMLGHNYLDRSTILGATTAGYFTGANQAFSKMLSQIGKVNSRSVSGSTEAIGFYTVLAVDIATLLARLNTNLEMVETFNPEMTRIREAYFKALTEESGDTITKYFINNRAQWKKIYAEYAARFNAEIVIPDDITVLKRRVWLASTMLKDTNVDKGQIYGFAPIGYHGIDVSNNKLTLNIDSCLGTSISRIFNDNWLFSSIDNFRLYMEHVFFELSKSSTYKELVSNMRAAIPSSKLAQLPEEHGNEPYLMGISDEVLSQIHNLEMPYGLGNASTQFSTLTEVLTDGDQIYEHSAITVYSNLATSNTYVHAAKIFSNTSEFQTLKCLSMYKSDCSPDDLIVATRLRPIWSCYTTSIEGSNNVNVVCDILACGTEIPLYFSRVFTDYQGVLAISQLHQYMVSNSTTWANIKTFFEQVSDLSKFDWIPPVYVFEDSSVSGSVSYMSYCDVGNVFPISNTDLSRMHEAATKSEYYVNPTIFSGFKS